MTSTNFIDLTGRRFNMLTAIARTYRPGDRRTYWTCRCDCGETAVVEGGALRGHKQQSCGCRRVEACRTSFTTHGAAVNMTREYRSWRNAKSRCYRLTDVRYPRYGGRGIAVCDRWRTDFAAFLSDMGTCPAGCSLDRIDGDRNYEPGNCRWATKRAQANNMSRNVMLNVGGQSLTVADTARAFGVSYHGLYQAVCVRGEDAEDAIRHLPKRRSKHR